MNVLRVALLCASVLVGTPARAEWALVVTQVEIYRCTNPLTYRTIEAAAQVSYQAAHIVAEGALAHDCTKAVQYRYQWPGARNRVSFLGPVGRSHLEVRFQSWTIVRPV